MKLARRANPSFSFLIVFAILLAITLASNALAQSRPAVEPHSLLAASDADAAWIIRKLPAAKDDAPHWLVLRRAHASTEIYWTQVATLAEAPIAIAPLGDRLAALNADGSWGFVDGRGRIAGPTIDDVRFVDVITSGSQLLFLTGTNAGDHTIVRFDGRSFVSPKPVAVPAQTIHYVVTDPGIGFIPAADNRDYTTDATQSSDGQRFADLAQGVITCWDPSDATPRLTIPLPPAALKQRLTLTHEPDGSVQFWWLEGDQVMSQRFGSAGETIGQPAALPLRPTPTPPLFERVLYIVGAITLLLVLLAGGRQTIAVTKALAAKSPPKAAPLARRLAAGIVDCVPLAATAAYLVAGGKLTTYGGMLRFDSHRSEAILAFGVIVYLLLLIALELRWQLSIGKWLFALRVTSIDGQRPTPRAILIRNVLRLVDLNLITLLIVPATPLRQRLGDFLAGTMVVDAYDAIPSPTSAAISDDRPERK